MSVSATSAAKILSKYQSYIDTYKGGLPRGFVAAIMDWESGGNNNITSSMGEVGLLQVTTSTCSDFALDPAIRYTVEGNIFAGCLNYQVDAARIAKRFPFIQTGSNDQWLFSRLVSAIGIGATQNLLKAYNSGGSYSNFQTWANNGGASGKTLDRVNGVVLCWNVGQAISSDGPGVPTKIPSYTPYKIPNDVSGLLQTPIFDSTNLKYVAIAGAIGILTYYLV